MMRMWSKTYESLFHWGLSLIRISHTDTVLDIGIGEGLSTHLISTKLNFTALDDDNDFDGFDDDEEWEYLEGVVYGIDYSSKAIEQATMMNFDDYISYQVRLLEASVLDLPFENNLFTKITAFQTHFHWGNFDRAMLEIHRVLKDDGSVLLACETAKISYYMKDFLNKEYAEKHFTDLGFQNIKIIENNHHTGYLMTKSK